jgi:hypothetical protein
MLTTRTPDKIMSPYERLGVCHATANARKNQRTIFVKTNSLVAG